MPSSAVRTNYPVIFFSLRPYLNFHLTSLSSVNSLTFPASLIFPCKQLVTSPSPNPQIFCHRKWWVWSSVHQSIFTYQVAAFKLDDWCIHKFIMPSSKTETESADFFTKPAAYKILRTVTTLIIMQTKYTTPALCHLWFCLTAPLLQYSTNTQRDRSRWWALDIDETGSKGMAVVPATKGSLSSFYGTRMRCNGLYATISALDSTSSFLETGSSNVRPPKRL